MPIISTRSSRSAADGLTPAVVKEIDGALKAHGLIKVRVFSDDRLAREALLADIADAARRGTDPAHRQAARAVALAEAREERGSRGRAQPTGSPARASSSCVKFSKSGNHRATVQARSRSLGNQRLSAGGLLEARPKTRASSVKKKAQD